MLDVRLLKDYSGTNDKNFIADTICTRIKTKGRDTGTYDGIPTSDSLGEFQLSLTVKNCDSILKIANASADLLLGGNMTFNQIRCFAKILGCHEKASEFGSAPKPELHPTNLDQQITSYFASQWDSVRLKGKKTPTSAAEFTVAGDISGLHTHLESLRRRTAVPTSELSTVKRLKKNDLNTELLEVLDGRTALHWAVYLDNLAVVKMLLEYAAIDGAETLKKVMASKDDTKDCPCISAIRINNLECIMEFIHAGFDFFDAVPTGGSTPSSAFAFLLTKASLYPSKYLENFKSILAELQKNPKFNPNMKLMCPLRSDIGYESYAGGESSEPAEWERGRDSSDGDGHGRRLHRRPRYGRRPRHYRISPRGPRDYPRHPRHMDTDFPAFMYRRAVSRSLDANAEVAIAAFDTVVGADGAGGSRATAEADMNGAGPSTHTQVAAALANDATLDVDALIEAGLSPRSVQRLFDEMENFEDEQEEDEDQELPEGEKSLLNLAAAHGGVEVLRTLLDLGATPEGSDLHAAVDYISTFFKKESGIACLELLLESGAVDINAAAPTTQYTVLHLIAASSCCDVLEFLLEKHANPTKLDGEGRTPLEIAEESGDTEAVAILSRFARLQRLSSQDERIPEDVPEDRLCVTCLQRSKGPIIAPCGHVSKKQPSSAAEFTVVGDAISLEAHLKTLHSQSNQPDNAENENRLKTELLQEYNHRIPASLAVYHNHPECLRLLLEYASKDNPKTFKEVLKSGDQHGDSPCSLAIFLYNVDCIMEFIRGGMNFFDINLRADGEMTSGIMLLVKRAAKHPERYLEKFKIILAELQNTPNFDVNMPIIIEDIDFDRVCRHRLMRMVMHGRGEEADELRAMMRLGLGQDEGNPEQEDDPAADADNGGDEALGEDAGDEEEDLRYPPEDTEAEPMESDHDDEEQEDDFKREINLLNVVSMYGGIEVLRILVELGATAKGDVLLDAVRYIEISIGRAAYSTEISMPNVAAGMACMEALIEAGADVNAEEHETKSTALHIAAAGKAHEAISLLLAKGADPGMRDDLGRTAAEVAEEAEDLEAVNILTRHSLLQRLSSFNRSASQRERNESQENAEEIPEDQECVVCKTRRRDVICAPCGHRVLCRGCTKRLFLRPESERKCPMCRHKLDSFVVQVFES